MEPIPFWITPNLEDEKIEYLVGAYKRLEGEFLEYFTYVPLTKNNLGVCSTRLADFILRIFPLISIAFNLLTFGNKMRNNIERNVTLLLDAGDSREKIIQLLYELYNKGVDGINLNDYYELHDNSIIGLWKEGKISSVNIMLKKRVNLIEYIEPIQPFNHSIWYSIKETRNAIEHRSKVDASLFEVLHCMGGLAFLISHTSGGISWNKEDESNIFEIVLIKGPLRFK